MLGPGVLCSGHEFRGEAVVDCFLLASASSHGVGHEIAHNPRPLRRSWMTASSDHVDSDVRDDAMGYLCDSAWAPLPNTLDPVNLSTPARRRNIIVD